MQLIQLSRAQDSLCLSFLFIDIGILLLGLYVCSTQQHHCTKVRLRLQVDWCPYVNCCSRLRRRRRLQRITGSSLATTCGPLVLQSKVKQKQQLELSDTWASSHEQFFILEPPNKCPNHLQSYELGNKTNSQCLTFHFQCLGLFMCWVGIDYVIVTVLFANCKQKDKSFYRQSGWLGNQTCKYCGPAFAVSTC